MGRVMRKKITGMLSFLGVLVFAGCGGESAAPPVVIERAVAPKAFAEFTGQWRARGVVETSSGSADQPVGTRLERAWVFHQRCADGRCRLWLSRESADIVESAEVRQRGDHVRAIFTRRTDGCRTRETGVLTRRFDITAGSAGLEASEVVAGAYPGCTMFGGMGRTRGTVIWKVTKVSSECPDMLSCRTEA